MVKRTCHGEMKRYKPIDVIFRFHDLTTPDNDEFNTEKSLS